MEKYRQVKSRIIYGRKVLGGMKMFCCRVMGMNVKRRFYEGIAVPTSIYGAKTWSVAAVAKRLNILQMRCLRSMCGIMHMNRVRNEEVQMRTDVMS